MEVSELRPYLRSLLSKAAYKSDLHSLHIHNTADESVEHEK